MLKCGVCLKEVKKCDKCKRDLFEEELIVCDCKGRHYCNTDCCPEIKEGAVFNG